MKVCKFGGTSLASAEQIRKACEIILADTDRKVMVVSAPGKRYKSDIKMTDLLISLADESLKGGAFQPVLDEITGRFDQISRDLGLDGSILETIREDLTKRLAMDKSDAGRYMDSMKAAGEDNSAKLVASYFQSLGHNARYIDPLEAGMLLTEECGNAQVLPVSYENLSKLSTLDGILVFPGFFGYTESGCLVTFPRGGSDITGSILTAALKADVYENFTDVDAVFVANPNVVTDPEPMRSVTYREMRELSYGGFSVLHEETIAPVRKAGIPVNIRNTNRPEAPGTLIVSHREQVRPGEVAGIACDSGFCTIYLSKYMMNREIGFGRKLLQIIEDEGLSYEHMPSGIDDISLILREKNFTPEVESRVIARIRNELQADSVEVQHHMALLLVVGEGMQHAVGMAARATGALARAKINLEMINQGSSEISMMFGIKTQDADDAVRVLYNEFFGRKSA